MEELWSALAAFGLVAAYLIVIIRAVTLVGKIPGGQQLSVAGSKSANLLTRTPGVGTVRGWPRLVRLVLSLVLLGVIVTAALAIFASVGSGDTFLARLNDAYSQVWSNTTGRPYTFIMRDNTWLFPLLALPGVVLLAYWLPRRIWARTTLIWIVFGLGFVAGHVYWGQ